MTAPPSPSSRRRFLSQSLGTSSALILAPGAAFASQAPQSLPDGKLIRTIQMKGNRRNIGKRTGSEWLGRLLQDLSKLQAKTLVTPNENFYIRTACPKALPPTKDWQIALRAGGKTQGHVAAADLRKNAKPMGTWLLECSGNYGNFGLMSAAAWSGVPIADVLKTHKMQGDYVLVDGFDTHTNLPAQTLQAGCSWIFHRKQLEAAGAFLATHMNGKPLPRDHGHPVRLFVPGWYGCTCVKWVTSIAMVDKDTKPTKQMREYARRTHQKGTPKLARDFRPAEIDTAAMPIRVEEWSIDDRTVFKILGVVWGGKKPVGKLHIHIGQDEAVPVSNFNQATHHTWNLWSHEWQPTRRGSFSMWLTVPDKKVRTRRLDRRYYKRRVKI